MNQSVQELHNLALKLILLNEYDRNRLPLLRDHIESCARCTELVQIAASPIGRDVADCIHLTSREIFYYAYPDHNVQSTINDEDRQSIRHDVSLYESGRHLT